MARMHSRAKGKSGSSKPLIKKELTWIRYKKKEAELLIAKLAKEGKTTSQIGVILRDTYGIPSARDIVGKKITQLLEEKKILPKLPEDLLALMKRHILIEKHMLENKKDMTALRGLQLTNSKIRRLVKYYKKTNRLTADWQYDPAKIKFYVE